MSISAYLALAAVGRLSSCRSFGRTMPSSAPLYLCHSFGTQSGFESVILIEFAGI